MLSYTPAARKTCRGLDKQRMFLIAVFSSSIQEAMNTKFLDSIDARCYPVSMYQTEWCYKLSWWWTILWPQILCFLDRLPLWWCRWSTTEIWGFSPTFSGLPSSCLLSLTTMWWPTQSSRPKNAEEGFIIPLWKHMNIGHCPSGEPCAFYTDCVGTERWGWGDDDAILAKGVVWCWREGIKQATSYGS